MAPKMIREESAALRFTPGFTICATVREHGNRLDGRHKKSRAQKIKHAYFSGRIWWQRAPRPLGTAKICGYPPPALRPVGEPVEGAACTRRRGMGFGTYSHRRALVSIQQACYCLARAR